MPRLAARRGRAWRSRSACAAPTAPGAGPTPSCSPSATRSGLVEIHATIRDVHARAEAERAQADAEARFRTAFEDAPIGMAIATIDGRFLQVNRALCAITGREQDELEGTPIVRLLHPEDREDEARSLARLARGDRESGPRRAALAARRRQDRLGGR